MKEGTILFRIESSDYISARASARAEVNRFKKQMPLLLDVPMFKGIRIHTGNKPEDSHGCLLVGKTETTDFVGNSRSVYSPLLERIQKDTRSGPCYITVVNT